MHVLWLQVLILWEGSLPVDTEHSWQLWCDFKLWPWKFPTYFQIISSNIEHTMANLDHMYQASWAGMSNFVFHHHAGVDGISCCHYAGVAYTITAIIFLQSLFKRSLTVSDWWNEVEVVGDMLLVKVFAEMNTWSLQVCSVIRGRQCYVVCDQYSCVNVVGLDQVSKEACRCCIHPCQRWNGISSPSDCCQQPAVASVCFPVCLQILWLYSCYYCQNKECHHHVSVFHAVISLWQ